jgi:hypothetical protein
MGFKSAFKGLNLVVLEVTTWLWKVDIWKEVFGSLAKAERGMIGAWFLLMMCPCLYCILIKPTIKRCNVGAFCVICSAMHVTAGKSPSSLVKCVTIGEWSLNGRDELEYGPIRILCFHRANLTSESGYWSLDCLRNK